MSELDREREREREREKERKTDIQKKKKNRRNELKLLSGPNFKNNVSNNIITKKN